MTIAGHTFHDTPHGRVCSGCAKRWDDIASATLEDLGKLDIAHTGALNAAEAAEIAAERDRIWEAVQKVCAA
jgi:hypothetical protein